METFHEEPYFDEDNFLEEENDESLDMEEKKYQASMKLYHDCTHGVVSQMELDRLNEEREEAERLANRKAGKNLSKTKTEDAVSGSTFTSSDGDRLKSKKHKLEKLFHQLTEEVMLEMENERRNVKRVAEDLTVANADRLRLSGDLRSEQQSYHCQNLESESQDSIKINDNDQGLSNFAAQHDENTPLSTDDLPFEKRSLHEIFFHQPSESSEDSIPLDGRPSKTSSEVHLDGIKDKMVQFEKSRPSDEKVSVMLPSSIRSSSKVSLDGVKDKLVRFENRRSSEEKTSVQRSPSKVSFNLASEGIKDKLERFENVRQENSLEHRPVRVSSKLRLDGIKGKFIHLDKSSCSLKEISSKTNSNLRVDGKREKLVQFGNKNLGKDESKDSISVGSEPCIKSSHEGVGLTDDVELKADITKDDKVDDSKTGKSYEIVDNTTSGNVLAVTANEKEYLPPIGKLAEDVPIRHAICTVPSWNIPQDGLVLPVGTLPELEPIQPSVGTISRDKVTVTSSDDKIFSKTCKEEFDNEELAITNQEQSLCDLKQDLAQIMSGLRFHTKQKQEIKLEKLRALNDPDMVISGKLPLELAYVSESRLDECRDDIERAATADEKIMKLRELKVESFLKGVLDVERSFHKELVSLNGLAARLEALNEVSAEWKKNPDATVDYNEVPNETSSTALCKIGAVSKAGNDAHGDFKSNAKGDSVEDVKDCEMSTRIPDSAIKFNVMAGDFK